MSQQENNENRASLGEHLRKERELRGIALEEVSKVTRVRLSYLHHLEGDDLTGLPADVYVRGYIRAYARFLGIDADECIERYADQAPTAQVGPVAAFEGDLEVIAPPLPALSGSGAGGSSAGLTGANSLGRSESSGGGGRRMSLALAIVMLVIAALAIAGVYYVNRTGDTDSEATKTPTTQNDTSDWPG